MDAYAQLLKESTGNFLELARHAPMHGLLTALRAVLFLDKHVRYRQEGDMRPKNCIQMNFSPANHDKRGLIWQFNLIPQKLE